MYSSSGTWWLGWFMCSECRDVIEFRCDNGRCVASMLTCDGQNDCGDYSDEIRPCSALLRLLFSFIKHSWNQVFRSRVTRVNDLRALSLISGQSSRHDYWLSRHGQTTNNAKVHICFQNCHNRVRLGRRVKGLRSGFSYGSKLLTRFQPLADLRSEARGDTSPRPLPSPSFSPPLLYTSYLYQFSFPSHSPLLSSSSLLSLPSLPLSPATGSGGALLSE